MRDDGLLAGPLDIDAPRRARRTHRPVAATIGVVVEERTTGVTGAIIEFRPPKLVVRDASGRDHTVRYRDGSVRIDGEAVALRRPTTAPSTPERTPSGSIAVTGVPARVARASRIWVEGVHDAELIEKVWGDDLRIEGVVVERLDGADDLAERVHRFGPRHGRRLGVLLDHLVHGSKETSLAAAVDHPDVLITGHPFVDVWQAVKPSAIGIDHWPEIAPGQPWKQGVLDSLGVTEPPGAFWKRLLGAVSDWSDLEAPLLKAVEQLIDFVAPPAD